QPHRRSTGQQRDPGSSALTLLPEKILRMRPRTVRGPKDLIPLPRRPSQCIHGSHQRRNSSSVRNRLGGVPPMLIGVLVRLRSAGRRPAVHPAAAVRHRWRLAPAPAPCPRPTPPAAVHWQFALRGVDPLISVDPPPPGSGPSRPPPARRHAH